MEHSNLHKSDNEYSGELYPQIASIDYWTRMTTHQAVLNHQGILYLLCREDGLVADANPACEDSLGYSHYELIGMNIESIIHTTNKNSFVNLIDCLLPNESRQSIVTFVTKDGRALNINLMITPVYADNLPIGYHILGHVPAALQKASEDLEHFKESMEMIQDIAHAGHWTWISSTDELYWSDGIYHILGIPIYRDNLTTERLGSFIHPLERDRIVSLVYDTLHNRSSYTVTYRIVCPRGERTIREHARVITDSSGTLRMIGIIQDITDYTSSIKEVARLNSIVQASPHFIAIFSTRGKLLYMNDAGKKLLGIRSDENMTNMSVFQFLGTKDPRKCKCIAAMSLMDKKAWSGECAFTTRLGSTIPVHLTITEHRDDDGGVESFSVIARSIQVQKRLENKIQHQTYHDALTGLPNRTRFMQELKHMTEEIHSPSFRGAVIFIDLDDFKQINDSLGHTVGDHVLIEVAKRLKTCIEPSDFVARWGGDEFVIILQNVDNSTKINQTIRRVINVIEESIFIHGEEFKITPSIGISMYPNDGFDSEALVKNADLAMYFAKRQTGKHCEYYTPAMSEDELERMTIKHELQRAISRNELVVYYQPLIDTKTLNVVGAEALIRWLHPAKGLIPPVHFIPIAEETGLIADIDSFVIQNVCEQIQKWNSKREHMFRVAVNISAKQFDDDSFIHLLENVVHRIDPNSLELEITESAIMKNERDTIEKLKRIREIGVNLSLDDFGTGYSSLNYLRLFSSDTIKIDLAFVNEITTKPEVAAITKSLIELAHALSMKVVAEGVETKEQLEILRSFGCDIVQGYLFSKPIPLFEFENLYILRSS